PAGPLDGAALLRAIGGDAGVRADAGGRYGPDTTLLATAFDRRDAGTERGMVAGVDAVGRRDAVAFVLRRRRRACGPAGAVPPGGRALRPRPTRGRGHLPVSLQLLRRRPGVVDSRLR